MLHVKRLWSIFTKLQRIKRSFHLFYLITKLTGCVPLNTDKRKTIEKPQYKKWEVNTERARVRGKRCSGYKTTMSSLQYVYKVRPVFYAVCLWIEACWVDSPCDNCRPLDQMCSKSPLPRSISSALVSWSDAIWPLFLSPRTLFRCPSKFLTFLPSLSHLPPLFIRYSDTLSRARLFSVSFFCLNAQMYKDSHFPACPPATNFSGPDLCMSESSASGHDMSPFSSLCLLPTPTLASTTCFSPV